MALFGARFPKENVVGETLQNFFLVFCLFWFVAVVVLRFGCFCHFGLLGFFFCKVGWGGEGFIFVFFVSRGLLLCYFIFLPLG